MIPADLCFCLSETLLLIRMFFTLNYGKLCLVNGEISTQEHFLSGNYIYTHLTHV